MILVLAAACAWLGSALAQSVSGFWWVAIVALAALVWFLWRQGKSFGTLASVAVAVSIVAVLPLMQQSVNPRVARVAQQFELHRVQATIDVSTGGFSHPGNLQLPAALRSSGRFTFSPQVTGQLARLGCPSVVVVGVARILPPRELPNAANQFQANLNQVDSVRCSLGFASEVAEATAWMQDRVRQASAGISPVASALVIGLTDGDDSGLPKELKSQMQLLSLTHLTAVSGTNCTIVVLALYFVFARLGFGRRVRIIGALAGLLGYLVLVGPQPSVLRSAAMAVLGLVGLFNGRRQDALSLLGLAALALLGIWPQLALSIGFGLSAAATFGVIWLAPKLAAKLQLYLPGWLAVLLSVTLAAQLVCLPLLVTLQSKFSLLSILANVLVEPLVPFITVLGVLAAVISLASPALAVPVFWVASVPAQTIVWVTGWLSRVPVVQNLPTGFWGVGFALVLLGAIILWVRAKTKLAALAAVVLAALLLGLVTFDFREAIQQSRFAQANWFYVACDVGQGDATVIRSQGRVAVIDVGPKPQPIDACLHQLHISHIDLLVLTHYDMDHVGGLSGALQGRRIDLALVTSFKDDRPAAAIVTRQLGQSVNKVIAAERGLSGQLGGFSWRVLSPHHQGLDSQDSNDGSVTMLFEGPAVWLLSLADLGEAGQMRLVQERSSWWSPQLAAKPLVLKVSHHGSADEYSEFMHWLRPRIATISVGAGNSYGHPTQRLLGDLQSPGTQTLRTDQLGSICVWSSDSQALGWAASSVG